MATLHQGTQVAHEQAARERSQYVSPSWNMTGWVEGMKVYSSIVWSTNGVNEKIMPIRYSLRST